MGEGLKGLRKNLPLVRAEGSGDAPEIDGCPRDFPSGVKSLI